MLRSPFAFVALAALLCPLAALAADADVKVSSVGYLPNRVKRASITASASNFSLKRDGDGSVAFSGTVTGPKNDPDTSQTIWTADFSSVTETGNFYLDVPGVGRSVSFPISKSAYREAFLATMLGFYGWRCNTAVSLTWAGQTYKHDACHMNDAALDYVGSAGATRDGHKGWHDAGDYGKYTVNAGITVGSLLAAWEEYSNVLSTYALPIPEAGGTTPDFLDEIRWELEWVLKMQYSDSDGRVSHKLTSLNFDPADVLTPTDWVLPELDNQTRYFTPWSSSATADFVAMLAKAARIYRPYDSAFADKCLTAAKLSYQQLRKDTSDQEPNLQTLGFKTGDYGTSDPDDRMWAAAEMWETTGDAAALADFESLAAKLNTKSWVDTDFDWSNVRNLGAYVYLQSKRTGRTAATVTAMQSALTKAADALVTMRNGSGYGRALSGSSGQYYWGSNGSVARTCMLLQVANRLSPKADYLDTCVDQISWIFGRNYYNRSQVTGVGINPPLHPHHRPSQGDQVDKPWPGLLVGGGNSTSKQATSKNGAINWLDVLEDYELNEVAINWNAPLVYALASFLDVDDGSGARDGGVSGPDSGAGPGADAGSSGRDGAAVSDAAARDGARPDAAADVPQSPTGGAGGAGGSGGGAGSGGVGSGGVGGGGVASGGNGGAASGGSAGSSTATSSGSSNQGCSCALGGAPRSSWAYPACMLLALAWFGRRVRRGR